MLDVEKALKTVSDALTAAKSEGRRNDIDSISRQLVTLLKMAEFYKRDQHKTVTDHPIRAIRGSP